ncbi:MAG TPA: iron ABC transporter permease [Dehalococcoidia bacterium]|nr:iron ABC transporter permease [Dehalococcoidia bacterium]
MQIALGPAAAHDDAPALVTWRTQLPLLGAGLALVLAVALVAVSWGTVHISPVTTAGILLDHLPLIDTGAYSRSEDAIIWDIRAPRVVLAGLVGAALALSGAAYQAVFRNPLAEPYLLGVAAGASVGATLVLISPVAVTAWAVSPVPPAAFAGAVIAVALAYSLARVNGAVPAASLILAGVAISSVGTSVVTYLMLTFNTRTLAILNWVLGGFNTANWTDVAIATPYLVVAATVLLPHARVLNVMQLDEDQARQLGVHVERTRLIVLATASLATAAAVSVSGLIGFVGLVVPHAVRLLFGPDYRRLFPLSALGGAAFLIVADMAARSIDPAFEVPIGVITAIVGAPFFLLLLRRAGRPAFALAP